MSAAIKGGTFHFLSAHQNRDLALTLSTASRSWTLRSVWGQGLQWLELHTLCFPPARPICVPVAGGMGPKVQKEREELPQGLGPSWRKEI
jgi:hypothetical protein